VKITIVGGGGGVGSSTAFNLLLLGGRDGVQRVLEWPLSDEEQSALAGGRARRARPDRTALGARA
jgi:malate/lactate dehydrogenase